MSNQVINDLWKQVNNGVNLVVWTQEQAEKYTRLLIEQGQVNRDDAQKLVNEIWEQNKASQKQFQNLIHEATNAAFSNWKIVTQSQFDDLTQKIDELTKKIQGDK